MKVAVEAPGAAPGAVAPQAGLPAPRPAAADGPAPPSAAAPAAAAQIAPNGAIRSSSAAREAREEAKDRDGQAPPNGKALSEEDRHNTLILSELFDVDLTPAASLDQWSGWGLLLRSLWALVTLQWLRERLRGALRYRPEAVASVLAQARPRLLTAEPENMPSLLAAVRMERGAAPLAAKYRERPARLAVTRAKLRALTALSQAGALRAAAARSQAGLASQESSQRLRELAAVTIQRVARGRAARRRFSHASVLTVSRAVSHWKHMARRLRPTRDVASTAAFQRELAASHMTASEFDEVVIGHHKETMAMFPELRELIQDGAPEDRVRVASSLVLDALHYRPMRTHRLEPVPLYVYHLTQDVWVQAIMYLLTLLHCALCFWEPASNLNADEVERYRSGADYMWVSMLDLALSMVHVWFLLLEGYSTSWHRFARHPLQVGKACVVAALLVDALVEAADVRPPVIRAARVLRPLLLVDHSAPLRRIVPAILSALPFLADVLLLMALIISALGCVGMFLFRGRYVDPDTGAELPENFNDFLTASLTLFVLLSKDNHPEVVRPVQETLPAAWPFFLVTLLLGIYIVSAVPVSVVFEAFKANRKKRVVRDRISERKALLAAFAILDTDNSGSLDQREFADMVDAVLGAHRVEEANKWFAMCDADGSGSISRHEFFEVCEVVFWFSSGQHSAWLHSPAMRRLGAARERVNAALHLDRLVQSVAFKVAVAAGVLADVALLWLDSHDWWYAADAAGHGGLRQAFLAMYVLESALAVAGLGYLGFFEDWWNCLDTALNAVTIGTELLLLWDDVPLVMLLFSRISRWARHADLLKRQRVVPLGAAERTLRRTAQMIRNIFTIMPSVVSVLSVFLIVFQVYAVVGLELYSRDWTVEAGFDPITNFGSYSAAMLALFQVGIGNNWSAVLHTAMEVRRNALDDAVAAAFFISFFLITCVVLTTLVVALVWDFFSVVANERTPASTQKKFAQVKAQLGAPPAVGKAAGVLGSYSPSPESTRRLMKAVAASRSMDVRVFGGSGEVSLSRRGSKEDS